VRSNLKNLISLLNILDEKNQKENKKHLTQFLKTIYKQIFLKCGICPTLVKSPTIGLPNCKALGECYNNCKNNHKVVGARGTLCLYERFLTNTKKLAQGFLYYE
jgi:hypothetical protein